MLRNLLNLIINQPLIIDENPLSSHEKYRKFIELQMLENEYQEFKKEKANKKGAESLRLCSYFFCLLR